MLNNQVFYHGTIRRTIIAFGTLFSNIYIDRRQEDSVTGPVIQRLQIPISYAPREKFLVRLDSDPNLENHTYTTLPRISFEITGYNYDTARKLNKMNQIKCNNGDTSTAVYTPVPYNLEISLYVLTKTQEDALQIIEQILPTFTPEYTLAINVIPDMHIVQNVPVVLNGVQAVDEYDGSFEVRRFVTHTLTFTLKMNLFGGLQTVKPIYSSQANVSVDNPNKVDETYVAIGDPATYAVTSETWTDYL